MPSQVFGIVTVLPHPDYRRDVEDTSHQDVDRKDEVQGPVYTSQLNVTCDGRAGVDYRVADAVVIKR